MCSSRAESCAALLIKALKIGLYDAREGRSELMLRRCPSSLKSIHEDMLFSEQDKHTGSHGASTTVCLSSCGEKSIWHMS